MTITLEEVECRLSEANEALKLYKEQQVKKQPQEPCPLEEGKEVQTSYLDLTSLDWTRGRVSVETSTQHSGWVDVVIRHSYDEADRDEALAAARKVLGGSTD